MKCKPGTDATVHIHFYSLPQPGRNTLDVHYTFGTHVCSLPMQKNLTKTTMTEIQSLGILVVKETEFTRTYVRLNFPSLAQNKNTFFSFKKRQMTIVLGLDKPQRCVG